VRYEIDVNGCLRQAEVRRANGGFVVVLDEQTWVVDAALVERNVLSLIVREAPATIDGAAGKDGSALAPPVAGGRSHEVAIAPNAATGQLAVSIGGITLAAGLNSRRRARGGDAGSSRSGPQRLVAPMPGKVVRVLVKVGDAVIARQPLVVVEAMKMENELRAIADGVVLEIHAREGQSVDPGTLLAVVGES
jgi:biotin carboxyl carrier protein